MAEGDGTFYKAVILLGVTFGVGFFTGYKVQNFSIGGCKNKSSHPGQGVEDGVAQKKAGKAGGETGRDSKGNRVHESSLVNGQGTSIIEILFLSFILYREKVNKPKWGTKR